MKCGHSTVNRARIKDGKSAVHSTTGKKSKTPTGTFGGDKHRKN